MSSPSNPDYCIEITTVQSSPFKILIDALKDLLTDITIEINPECIKIVTMDNSHVILVHLKLEASKFEQFYCEGTKIMGINMLNFHKIIKTVSNNDTLTLFMDRNDINHLGVRIANNGNNSCSSYKINLLDLEHTPLQIPPADFTSVITLPSTDLQKLCRDMDNIADCVEIKNIDNQLVLSCTGDFCSQETVIHDTQCQEDDAAPSGSKGTNKVAGIVNNNEEIFQGVYSLKYLVLFTKCTNLSKTVEIYLKNNYPLIVRYTVASLGDIKLCVSPLTTD